MKRPSKRSASKGTGKSPRRSDKKLTTGKSSGKFGKWPTKTSSVGSYESYADAVKTTLPSHKVEAGTAVQGNAEPKG